MDITLEQIELVKDRTGVRYKEAREALEACDGNVVDAIISIEENMEEYSDSKFMNASSLVISKIKEILEKGNVVRIKIKKEDDIVLNLPVIAGVFGIILAPVGAAIGAIVALGFKYKVEIEKEDGEIIHIEQIAEGTFNTVKEKGIEVADIAKEKGAEAFNSAKNYASETLNKVKEKGSKKED